MGRFGVLEFSRLVDTHVVFSYYGTHFREAFLSPEKVYEQLVLTIECLPGANKRFFAFCVETKLHVLG